MTYYEPKNYYPINPDVKTGDMESHDIRLSELASAAERPQTANRERYAREVRTATYAMLGEVTHAYMTEQERSAWLIALEAILHSVTRESEVKTNAARVSACLDLVSAVVPSARWRAIDRPSLSAGATDPMFSPKCTCADVAYDPCYAVFHTA